MIHPSHSRGLLMLALLGGVAVGVSGCAQIGGVLGRGASSPAAGSAAASGAGRPNSGGILNPVSEPAADLDTVSAAERARAQEARGGKRLGTTIASLGDPTREGLWVRTPLVRAQAEGRIEDPKTGASVAVQLLPLDAAPGAGSQVSLSAMNAMNLSLTALPEIAVFRN